jgi:two-component system, OmpR family, phosphate regulon response regulator PhoB
MRRFKILVVEDEVDIGDLLQTHLTSLGYEVKVISRGDEALTYIQTLKDSEEPPHLFILDRMLPGNSGIEICRFLKLYQKTKYHPILMLTALSRPEDIVEGLDAGADDYITKPFETDIFLARVRALLRRFEIIEQSANDLTTSAVITVGKIKIDKDQCKAFVEGKEVELTLSEYKILCAFMEAPGKVLTRNQLVEYIQEGPIHVTDRTIDTHIFGLRKKLGSCSNMIETIRGIGYRVTSDA